MAARSGQGARAVDVTSLGMPRFSVRSISGLAGPRHSFVIARRSGGIRGEFGSKPAQLGFSNASRGRHDRPAVFDEPFKPPAFFRAAVFSQMRPSAALADHTGANLI